MKTKKHLSLALSKLVLSEVEGGEGTKATLIQVLSWIKTAVYFVCILQFSFHAIAQTGGIRGTTLSDKGEPLPFVGIYVKNINSGTSSNLNAKFEIKLGPGEYTLVVQSLGYQTEQQIVKVENNWVELNLILKSATYSLGEVTVGVKDEDPAYAIMRKAISMATFYQYQVQEYSTRVYTKGVAKLEKIPWLVRKIVSEKELKESGVDTGKIFLVENVTELNFKQPNAYSEKVISVRTNMQDSLPSPVNYIKGSFYYPTINENVSPLSPKALSYYTFVFEGSFYDGEHQINKIKVTPRSKGDGVFEGTIYIVENLWCIHSVSLSVVNEGITTVITQLYSEVQNKVWMPLMQSYVIYGSVLGLSFNAKYQATCNNYKIKINDKLLPPTEVIDQKTEKDELANVTHVRRRDDQSLDSLLQQGDKKITQKDFRKLMKMYEKDEAKKEEAPEVVSNETMEIDSMAYRRDSTFWQNERVIPLTNEEEKSYKLNDSLVAIEKNKKAEIDSSKDKISSKIISGIGSLLFSGYEFKFDSSSTLKWQAPITSINYNTVDRFIFSTSLVYDKNFKNKNELKISPIAKYSQARNLFYAKGKLNYQFSKDEDAGSILLEGGKDISQFNSNDPIHYFFNGIATLLFESNFMKIYEKEYFKLAFSKKITDQLFITANGEFSNRTMLTNSPNARPWINWKQYAFTSNTPVNNETTSTNFSNNRALVTELALKYFLWKKYSIENGIKTEIEDSYPELKLNYKKGWKNVFNSDIDFDYMELGIKYQYKLRARAILNTEINCGGFINNNKLYFMDYKHFDGNRIFIQESVTGYRLLDYYNYSTANYFAEGFFHFQTPKLVITQFVYSRMLGLKENIFLNYLYTPSSNNYIEVGYGLDKIFRLFRLELVSSFNNFKYQSFGLRIGFASGLMKF